jgi:nitrite reductase (NADH) small subunit/3-phenylpropionate/trans-cinnamate dioxygenase ferredoxin subunit
MADYLKAANVQDIAPGSMHQLDLNGEQVVLANVDGSICAFSGVCTHRGGPLAEGELDGDIVTCPWHGGQFNVRTGEVVSMPPTENIRIFPVQIEGAEVKVAV